MGRKYSNPPIIEAACEFVFASDIEWDSAIPGLIYAQDVEAQNLFPNREQRSRSVIICSSKESPLEEPEIKRKEYTVFLNQDKTMFIKVTERGISMYEDYKHDTEEIEAYELPVHSPDIVVYLCKTHPEEGEYYEGCQIIESPWRYC